MFIEAVRKERLRVSPVQREIESEVLDVLRKKIPGKVVEENGITLFPVGIESIDDVEVHEGMLYPLVAYRLVMFQAFPGEVLNCTVEKQDSTGIMLSHPLLPSIFVPASQMPSPSELTLVSGRMGTPVEIWGWKYNECVLYIRMGEVCRVSIIDTHQPTICASISGPGLGPVAWW
ncbi:DNA-directed RNA polymerase III subunit RPC8 [Nematocida major]|uniref:DNA-directed RNA polymerase III subunit RPC8 n=1 Tax=Nematocida major TaxID=1912982 RepID=UPI002007E20A|nr:DNA-directed RNA polymerase III subunit RPC8 [Nematocida major]KAH9385404.1 DNA-directed RNA polymerase III subunit RPC8 [Nematocida major]